jgi:hypothetical protein
MNPEHLAGIVAVVLFIWSAVLLWATWQVHRMIKELDAERRELRRYERLARLAKRQNGQWQ